MELTKQALVAAMEQAWSELDRALQRLTPDQWTAPTDDQGWSVTDHVVHMAAWAQSVVFLLHHRPRHAGLGIDEALYLGEDYDAINAVIRQQNRALTPQQAQAWLQSAHNELLSTTQALDDELLSRPYRYWLPDEPGDGDGPPAARIVYNNSADHYREHLGWISNFHPLTAPTRNPCIK